MLPFDTYVDFKSTAGLFMDLLDNLSSVPWDDLKILITFL